jgi:hypothetical protein
MGSARSQEDQAKQYRVIAPHKASYPDPISFSPSDRLKLGRRDDQYPGWIWTTIADGKEGWAPESLIHIG